MSTPYPLYRADANSGRLRHRRTGSSDWPPAAGQPRGATTRLATQGSAVEMRDRRVLSAKASGSFVAETFLPAPDHRLGLAGGLHDLSRAATIGRQKDDLCPPSVLLRAIGLATTALSLPRSARLIGCSFRSCIPLDSPRESFRESQANRSVRFGPLVSLLDLRIAA